MVREPQAVLFEAEKITRGDELFFVSLLFSSLTYLIIMFLCLYN